VAIESGQENGFGIETRLAGTEGKRKERGPIGPSRLTCPGKEMAVDDHIDVEQEGAFPVHEERKGGGKRSPIRCSKRVKHQSPRSPLVVVEKEAVQRKGGSNPDSLSDWETIPSCRERAKVIPLTRNMRGNKAKRAPPSASNTDPPSNGREKGKSRSPATVQRGRAKPTNPKAALIRRGEEVVFSVTGEKRKERGNNQAKRSAAIDGGKSGGGEVYRAREMGNYFYWTWGTV